MQELKIFENTEFGTVRALEIEGAPWFVGKDVADILGYKDTSDALKRHVDADDKLSRGFTDSGQSRDMYIINESGLYSLVLSSKLPAAKAFKRWITHEVLPAIRQHGAYMTDATLERALNEPDFLISLATKLKAEREARKALEVDNKIKDQQIAELKPKASYYDLILQCSGLLSVTEIAKDYGLSAKALNKMLHDLGIQFSQSGVWFLYSKYQSCGYTQTKTQNYSKPDGTQGARVHTYWTQKGRLFLYDLLKRRGVLPMIERTEAA